MTESEKDWINGTVKIFASKKYDLYGKYKINELITEGEFYEFQRYDNYSYHQADHPFIYLPKIRVDTYLEDKVKRGHKIIPIGLPLSEPKIPFHTKIMISESNDDVAIRHALPDIGLENLTFLKASDGPTGATYWVKKVHLDSQTYTIVSLTPTFYDEKYKRPKIIYVPNNNLIETEKVWGDHSLHISNGGSKQKTRKNRRKSNRRKSNRRR